MIAPLYLQRTLRHPITNAFDSDEIYKVDGVRSFRLNGELKFRLWYRDNIGNRPTIVHGRADMLKIMRFSQEHRRKVSATWRPKPLSVIKPGKYVRHSDGRVGLVKTAGDKIIEVWIYTDVFSFRRADVAISDGVAYLEKKRKAA